ncbi:phosphoenolpyruvate synthase [Saccharicrinis carchari]|uniref:Phosphoenolpyruvate synthase n=2 Tax=Saccharicrinis carchari TaxID=1168039 RepID=A0A521DZN1_SACCC|nr:phosphoenolpyruvate synthase [Saccharicrinis carchari]
MAIISIQSEIKNILPQIQLAGLEASVAIAPTSPDQGVWIRKQIEKLQVKLSPETIRQTPNVKATKDAYRALGKDPNRYRPAAEALMRRIANGKGLYEILNAVDVLNYISIKTGFSICGYDASQIVGNISLGIGKAKEPYEGIGRGELNIERLPVFRDAVGAFGTPTSDSTRTMINHKTNKIIFIYIGFNAKDELEEALTETTALLVKYADATDVSTFFI